MPDSLYHLDMNRLSTARRARILHHLVEGSSLRSISRLEGVSINTVTKLLVDAGRACALFHDEAVRDVPSRRIEVDEIWSFVYAKAKNVLFAKAAPADHAGDTWTWTALDAESKLIVSWVVGPRDAGSAFTFMHDLADRLRGRVQISADGLGVYVEAVEGAFGADVDFGQVIKVYSTPGTEEQRRYSPPRCTSVHKNRVAGDPDELFISTSYVERQNLNLRMGVRRFTRLTNAFSKKLRNHMHALSLYYVFNNFCRVHKTLRTTPAMAAGLDAELRDLDWLAGVVDARTPPPAKPGPKPGARQLHRAESN